jgi:hypothetical protein
MKRILLFVALVLVGVGVVAAIRARRCEGRAAIETSFEPEGLEVAA